MKNLPQEYYLQQEEIYSSFISQLKKDAAMSDIEINDNILSSHLSEMIINFTHLIESILQKNNGYEKIQTWLYRVDVPEKLIKEKIHQMPVCKASAQHASHCRKDEVSPKGGQTKKYSEIIAEMIIKRTLQKVVLKYLYRNK